MSTIRREIHIAASADAVWDAIRDVGAVDTRLAPGFVTGVRMEDGARIVTLFNGLVAREIIVSIDDDIRRLVWTIVGGRMSYHHGTQEVFSDGPGRTRLIWTTDLLPEAVAPAIEVMIDTAVPIIKATLERTAGATPPAGQMGGTHQGTFG